MPEWLNDYNSGNVSSLRYNREFRDRIELIQDFDFPSSSTTIQMTRDQQYIGVSGVYKPQIKVFETNTLGMKFERHIDSEIVHFDFLSDDYSKIAMIRNDRTIEIHASYGKHFSIRIPKFGRKLAYHYPSCDLYVAASGNQLFRLNLAQGIFNIPLETTLNGSNDIKISPVHQLITVAGENGSIECFDPRDHHKIKSLYLANTIKHSSTYKYILKKC